MYTSTGAFQLWLADQTFMRLFATLHGKTLVDVERCHVLYQLAIRAKELPGAAAEIGVYKGGTARLLAEVFGRTKKLRLYDTSKACQSAVTRTITAPRGCFQTHRSRRCGLSWATLEMSISTRESSLRPFLRMPKRFSLLFM